MFNSEFEDRFKAVAGALGISYVSGVSDDTHMECVASLKWEETKFKPDDLRKYEWGAMVNMIRNLSIEYSKTDDEIRAYLIEQFRDAVQATLAGVRELAQTYGVES